MLYVIKGFFESYELNIKKGETFTGVSPKNKVMETMTKMKTKMRMFCYPDSGQLYFVLAVVRSIRRSVAARVVARA